MNNITELVENLYSKDNKFAYKSLQILEEESKKSNVAYKYFDRFVDMIEDENSYVRTRGLILIASNTKWDVDNKVDEVIDSYLKHILDVKPITARQCIKVLPNIAKYKEDLVFDIKSALLKADVEIYKESMRDLVYKDIREALRKIENIYKVYRLSALEKCY